MVLTSLWQDRPLPSPDRTADVSGSWDVVIVGAGVTGLTTACLLARAGKSVLVLEARRIGSGTTGGSTAKVSLLQGTQLSEIARRHPSPVVESYVRANLEGQAWLMRWCDGHGVATQRRPAYTYATSPAGRESAQQEHDIAQKAGLPVSWVEELDLPYPTRGAATLAEQAQLDPVEMLVALAADAEQHGATIVESARVRRIRGRRTTVVGTDAGEATAGTVVLATNTPLLDRGGHFARLSAARSYGLAFRTDAPAVNGMYLSTDAPSRSLRDAPADDGAYLLVGGNGHGTGRAASPRAAIEDLRRWTGTHFPSATETHAWSAQDYVPHHALPYAGPLLPGADHLLVAGGYSKWGMTNGVAAAHALTGRILGVVPDWAEVLGVWTARELKGLPTGLRANGEVGWEMTSGWIRALAGPRDADVEEGEGVVRLDHAGAPSAISRVDGVERRVSAVCSHLGGIVRWNDAERSWDCPLHGSRFDPDGEVLEGPVTCGLTRRATQ